MGVGLVLPPSAGAGTAAEVLAALLTVDGLGSLLDADTIDGLNSDAFALASALAAHAALTASVHGISNTANLYQSGGTDVAVADGGTGASTAANARTNLELVIGSHVQAFSAVLAATTASFLTAQETKLAGIEALADVTDAANVAAAGAVMEADTTTAAMGFVVDEDNMASNSATKLPTQQSVKAYVDAEVADAGGATNLAYTPAVGNGVVTSDTGTDATVTAADGTNAGLLLPAGFTKLGGIEALADVTDAGNVAAAGAHMSGGTDVPVTDGGTGSSTAAGARTNLGLVIGTDVNAAGAYTPGGTDVAVADGGTGSSTAAGARTNLGLVIGTDVAAFGVIPALNSSVADDSVSGTTVTLTAAENLVLGDVCYVNSSGKMAKGDADAIASSLVIAFATATIATDATGVFLSRGLVRDDSAYNFTPGGAIYLSTTAGGITQTAPSGTLDVICVLGVAITADIWFFSPNLVLVERV